MSLSELSEIINKHIYLTEKGINNSKKDISELLFKAIEHNGNIKGILNLSESFTLNAFVLLDNNMKTISISNNFSKYSHLIPELGKLFFSPADTKRYIDQFTAKIGSSYIHLNSNNLVNDTYTILYPIKSDEIFLGYLLCISDESISSETGLTLIYNKIILALSILLLKESVSFEYKNHKSDMFLESLLNNETLSDTEIEKTSMLYNLPLKSSYVCCIVSFTKVRKINYANDWIGIQTLKGEQIIACWHRYSASVCKLFFKNNNIIMLLQTNGNTNSTLDLVKNFCHDVHILLARNGLEKDVLIGIGNTSHSLRNLHSSYYQAKKTIETMLKINSQKIICTFDECLIYQLIYGSEYIKRTLKEKLLPLVNYDINHNTQLLLTLESYLNNNQNVTLASKSLFIHRNTLYYRLERIIGILNIDFDNYDLVLIYQLAMKALKSC